MANEMDGGINEEFINIIESIPDATFVIDRDKKVIAWNHAIEEMTGVRKEDILEKSDCAYAIPFYGKKRPLLIDLLDKSDEEIEAMYRYVKRKGADLYAEVFVPSLFGGKGAFLWAKASPILDRDANPIGAVEFIRDVTEQKLANERLEKLNRELNRSSKIFKQLTLRDSHTGLFNHRHLEETIEAEFFRAKRYSHSLSVTMLDLDYFKSINDVYGHQFGDLVLKQMARQLKRIVRQYDIVVRFGGEEFIIISPATGRSEALKLTQRIFEAITLYDFGDKRHAVKLKLSIAVASYPEDKMAKGMDLIDLVHQILNKVKEYGGNRIGSSIDLKYRKRPSVRKDTKRYSVKTLKLQLERLTEQANRSLAESVFAFAKTIELKDHYTGEHVEKTVHYATTIARALNMPPDEIERIRQAAMLHDLGKIGISEKILLKNGRLTDEEFEEIKKHPQIGVDIIRPVQFLHGIIPLIFYHHERWDGQGYASGLKGDDIPIGARIVAISDVYEALISDRPYRKAYPKEEAMKVIEEGATTQFDPKIVEAFLKVLKQEDKVDVK